MNTTHKVLISNAQMMSDIEDRSIDLVVTSPPYPMIEMWDETMASLNPEIGDALGTGKSDKAFELMHLELDKVWKECYRVLKDGSLMCINIGDATRTINGKFQLFNNHSRIVQACQQIGFTNLPNIIWRKQTNAPNKFMGSGMLPCGAYITLEHEWILVFRKGDKRDYKTTAEKNLRRHSSFFWEERNQWFSDLWDIKGVKQKINGSKSRERSAAFPLSIPYRLINMYSQVGDTVLDPFGGLFTTSVAAILCGRNSVGLEIDGALLPTIRDTFKTISLGASNRFIKARYDKHISFIKAREAEGKEIKHYNDILKCKVMTSQETDISFHYLTSLSSSASSKQTYTCMYEDDSDMQMMPVESGCLFEPLFTYE